MRHYPADHAEMAQLVALHASLWQPVRAPNSDVVIAIPEALEALEGGSSDGTPPPGDLAQPHVVRWTGVARGGTLVVAVGASAEYDEPPIAPSTGWQPRSDFNFETSMQARWQTPGFKSKLRPVSRLRLLPSHANFASSIVPSRQYLHLSAELLDASVLGLQALTEALLGELSKETADCYRSALRLQSHEARAKLGVPLHEFSYGELGNTVSFPDLQVLDYLTRNGVSSLALERRCQFARAYPLLALSGMTDLELDARVVAALPMEEWVATRCRMSPRVQRFLRAILPSGRPIPGWLSASNSEAFLNACTPETLNALTKSCSDGGGHSIRVIWGFLTVGTETELPISMDKPIPFSSQARRSTEYPEFVAMSARRATLLANSLEIRGGKLFDDDAADLSAHWGEARYALFSDVFRPLFIKGIKRISRKTLPGSLHGVSSLVKDILGPSTLPMRRLLRLLDVHLAEEMRRNAEEDARGVDPSVVTWGARMNFVSPGGIVLTALTSRDALRAEGRAMEHCVGDLQVPICVANTCCILSLTDAAGARLSTVELVADRLGTNVITKQHHGPKNSPPPEAAARALAWLLEGMEAGTLDLGSNMPQARRNSAVADEAEHDLNEPVAVLQERIAGWVNLWGHGARGVEDMLAAVRADDVLRVYHADVLAAVDAGLDSLSEDEQE